MQTNEISAVTVTSIGDPVPCFFFELMEVPAGGMHGAPLEPLDDDRTPSQSMSRLDSCESESKVSYLKAGKPAWGDIPFPKFPTDTVHRADAEA